MSNAPALPVRWDHIERIRIQGKTQVVMVSAEGKDLLLGYMLRWDSEGDLDFQTIKGEDQTSRVLFMFAVELITKRTRLRQDLHTAQWVQA